MGKDKLALRFPGGTVLSSSLYGALSFCARVALVVAPERKDAAREAGGAALSAALSEGRVVLVDSPRWREGMLRSVAEGLSACVGTWCFVAPADLPLLRAEHYRSVALAIEASRGEGYWPIAALASSGGVPAHPALLDRAGTLAIIGERSGERLRPLLPAQRCLAVDLRDPATLADVDDEEAYRSALALAALR
jgi:CTP:molybdopterin cytidylyltransferase MocA